LIFLLITNKASINEFIFIVLTGFGLYISFLLLKEKFGFHSPSVLNICTATSNTNCNDVINSKGGVIYKDVSLADMSFLFFALVIILKLLLPTNNITNILIIASLPIALYSIFYQAFAIKKWCPLCLGVVAILFGLNFLVIPSI